MTTKFRDVAWLMMALLGGHAMSFAADPVDQAGVRRALIVCGHPGDAEHRAMYDAALPLMWRGLTAELGFDPAAITVLDGIDEERPSTLELPVAGPATREQLTQSVEELRQALRPEDALWVIVVGHAHHDGRLVWLNLPGPDLNQDEFGALFRDVSCREQVFWITTPTSGYFLKALAASERVVVSATEADFEINATLCPTSLAEELNPDYERPLVDADRDGAQTLFDLIIAVRRNTARKYLAEMLLATEHGLVDDNGDGRGTEVQRDYLTEEEGGRPRRNFVPGHPAGVDGARSAAIVLPWGPISALRALP